MALIRAHAARVIAGSVLSAIMAGCSAGGPVGSGEASVRFIDSAVEVTGLAPATLRELRRDMRSAEEWALLLPIWVGEAVPGPAEDRPTLLGTYSVSDSAVRFEPRFPFAAGETYHAVWHDPDSAREVASASWRLPTAGSSGVPGVTAVFPSASELPENLLRFYIHFATPMSRERAQEALRLVGPDGPIEMPFVAIEHELWNPRRDRLTLILDPGRIKRGVEPNLTQGPSLSAGAEYRLQVDGSWPDGSGTPLGEGFTKSFRVVEADRIAPDPEAWKLLAPGSARDSVTLRFPQPLDHGLLLSAIRVEGPNGPVEGRTSVGDAETTWAFTPEEVWPAGRLRLVVDPALEDPAGNSIRRLFDRRQRAEVGSGERRQPVTLDFAIASVADPIG